MKLIRITEQMMWMFVLAALIACSSNDPEPQPQPVAETPVDEIVGRWEMTGFEANFSGIHTELLSTLPQCQQGFVLEFKNDYTYQTSSTNAASPDCNMARSGTWSRDGTTLILDGGRGFLKIREYTFSYTYTVSTTGFPIVYLRRFRRVLF